jgi:hypothetical protein
LSLYFSKIWRSAKSCLLLIYLIGTQLGNAERPR